MFKREIIHLSISGLSINGICGAELVKLSTLAYNEKNEYVLYSVPKNLRLTSSTPFMSNFRLSHGCALVSIYHLSESAPYSLRVVKGSTALPSLLLILLPSLSRTRPLDITVLYATLSLTIVDIACRVKNHPLVWSTPSAIKSAVCPNSCEPSFSRPICA
ncbi:hypothetical protein SDC9_171707 [bioreactor metagenome]|uniref:Uncharacterized protein n=1 Tax=bioreactor metagenome TaxID=1076179 RepID=A0A645GDZ9_9ZZZZ